MNAYRYLVVGGGMTGDAVCNGIRDVDDEGTIGLVGEEPVPPYKRPPLTKGLWKGGDEAKIWRERRSTAPTSHLGRRIVSIDPAARTRDRRRRRRVRVREARSSPRAARRGGSPDGGDDVVYFRTLDDYRRVRALSDEGARFLVVGGGFIGSEIAAALRDAGARRDDGVPRARHRLADLPRRSRARRSPTTTASAASTCGRSRCFESAEGFDAVVAGLGIVPRTELAEAAGFPVDDGIVVDELRARPRLENVFAAGDVARFPMPALGKHRPRRARGPREHARARSSARTPPGATSAYEHLPFFYSDLFDLGYEAVGELDSRNSAVAGVARAVPEGRRRVRRRRRVGPRGFLLWNVWDKVDAARELIRAAEPIGEETLRGLAG